MKPIGTIVERLGLRRLGERLKQARLGMLIVGSMGGLFTVILVAATQWARWQASWPEPWNRPVWLWVGLIPHVVMVAFIAVYILRRLVLDPLADIQQTALRIADGTGRTGEQIPMPVGEELQALVEAFNVMSSALQAEHALLERRVAERTARLDALNAELRAEVEGRRRVEQSLRDSEVRYRGLFDHALTGIVLLRLIRGQDGRPIDFTITDLNAAAETLTGLPAATTIGRRVSEVSADVDRPVRETIARVALGAKATRFDYYVSQLNRHFAVSVFALQPEQVAVEFEDITDVKVAQRQLAAYSERLAEVVEVRTQELHEAQEKLIRREKLALLGQMAGSVGHELRNPLAVIGNAATLLSYALEGDDPEVQHYALEIGRQVAKSDKIIRDLLNLARTRAVLRLPTAVYPLLSQAVDRISFPDAVEVAIDTPPALPPLLVDSQQIELVLDNLLRNAGEAMPAGGRIRISARQEGRQIALGVSDSGPGIPRENLPSIFEPLFTTKSSGIGLGLAVCQNLVQLNGGTIEVESVVGQGTTFTVWLPVADVSD